MQRDRGSVSFLDEFNQLHDQCILVTGAAGFVGSRLLASQNALAMQPIKFVRKTHRTSISLNTGKSIKIEGVITP